MTPVIVTWRDAHGDAYGWTHVHDLDGAERTISTVGWLLSQAKPGHVSVAQSIDGELVDSVLHVPVESVTNVRSIE